ncbi:MAG: response regulator [Acidobacteriota bacterium]
MRRRKKTRIDGPHLAVVEEVADDIYSIKFILQSLRYQVRSFSYSQPFLEELVEFTPKMIIVDMMIPMGGGFDVIRHIRSHPELKQTPLLAITADAMEGKAEDVIKAGGQDYLAKPYAVGELQEKLEHWIQEPE